MGTTVTEQAERHSQLGGRGAGVRAAAFPVVSAGRSRRGWAVWTV